MYKSSLTNDEEFYHIDADLVPMPWPLVPMSANNDWKPSGVSHCKRRHRQQLFVLWNLHIL